VLFVQRPCEGIPVRRVTDDNRLVDPLPTAKAVERARHDADVLVMKWLLAEPKSSAAGESEYSDAFRDCLRFSINLYLVGP